MTDPTNPPNNSHKSLIATIIGALVWILTGTGAGIISHFLPGWVVNILHPLGELLTAIGAAMQLHQNTQATVASTAAVTQAIVTNAPANLAPNPSIVAARAAGAGSRSPMQGGGAS